MSVPFPIFWLTGNSGTGKTTLATGVSRYFNEVDNDSPIKCRVIVLDGDEMRASISTEEGFSAEERRRHNLRVARLAKVLQAQGFLVVIAVIAPFQSVRDEIDAICHPRWVYIKCSGLEAPDRPYEQPHSPAAVICTDVGTAQENTGKLIKLVELFIQEKYLHKEKNQKYRRKREPMITVRA